MDMANERNILTYIAKEFNRIVVPHLLRDTLQLAYPISSWQHGPCLAGGTDGGQEN